MAEAATKMPVKTEKTSVPSNENDWMPFDSLRREIDRLFEDFRPFGWPLPTRRSSFAMDIPRATDGWSMNPAFDFVEKNAVYEITAELPGIDEKNIEIKLSNHLLTIRGEKSESKEEKDKDYFLSERRFGSFQRSFRVPEGVDTDRIDANFSKGLLTLHLPKSAEARNAEKKIEVRAS
ncbi:Hsp20/alpha crystallin family protein [Georhizobium profundi]|uniref:Hsp20/alpha crystallin family protein n=1 Tax=Georhizobium profundi TaxID=2341112 RepID=A0A3Q8XP27_9HYPH|nr:Hsp20/alpha crystallin family protein [Georhizobium profundi]AZN71895.1 Hsp20/alpha crystallin family protein [Georhizobium profundi]